jgi:hypothetical protein
MTFAHESGFDAKEAPGIGATMPIRLLANDLDLVAVHQERLAKRRVSEGDTRD